MGKSSMRSTTKGSLNDQSTPAKRLTVLIPTHNRPDLLRKSVRSALADTLADIEVLVIDDASERPARIVLADIAAVDSRLRVLRNHGLPGAAGARNFGVAEAKGEIVLFLDDDDEIISRYPARVLEIASASEAGYGFSAILRSDGSGHEQRIGRRHRSGQILASSALRHKIAGLGTGFWIRRALFMEIGGFDPRQIVDEDTDLCCNLIGRGHLPWYEDRHGVRIRDGHTEPGALGAQLTRSARADVVLDCYLRTWQRHEGHFSPMSEARWFLGVRFLRRAAKYGSQERINQFLAAARPWPLMLAFRAYVGLKQCSALHRHGGPSGG